MALANKDNIKKIVSFLESVGATHAGAVGMTANIYAESRCNPMCVEAMLIEKYKKEGFLKWDYGLYDENTYKQYWSYYDSGAISEKEFISPRQYTGKPHHYGMGICQWTTYDRKKKWLSLAKDDSKPLTDMDLQLNFLYWELKNTYTDVWNTLHLGINMDITTNYVLMHFEQPAHAETLRDARIEYAHEIEDILKEGEPKVNITIGSARIDENGHVHGGKAGDQTGKEVSEQSYYLHSGGWRAFRLKDPAQAQRIAAAMRSACNNSNWGYNQYQRYSGMKRVAKWGYDPSKLDTPAATDCSNLVRVCFIYSTEKDPGDFDTSGEASALKATGLVDEVSFNQNTGSGLCKGDILVTRKKGHTVIVTGGPERTSTNTIVTPNNSSKGVYMFDLPLIKMGSKGNAVLLFQEIFDARNTHLHWGQKDLELDGICGSGTVAAIKWYQKQRGLTVDGECGEKTWADLIAL